MVDSDSVMSVAALVARDDRFEITFFFWISIRKMKIKVKTIISIIINKIQKIQNVMMIQCLIWCCLCCFNCEIDTAFAIGDCCFFATGNATGSATDDVGGCTSGDMELFFY
jgi:hypothetical protein